jgi:hypothetical protein
MQVKSKVLKWLIILGAVLVVQTLTFYLVSDKQLEGKLLPDYFQFAHHSDSAYVRDFYGAAEDPPIFTPLSHDLKSDQERLKEKLKVKFVYFEQPSGKKQIDEKSFNLVYYTWIQRGDWLTLSNFFKMKQIEHVVVDKKRIYKREVIYQWCLLFWIKSSEFIQSDDLATDG